MGREEQMINERKRKLKELRQQVNPYPHKFDVKNYSKDIKEGNKKLKNNERSKNRVSVAGRVMTIRNLGKLIFATIQDSQGRLQLILHKGETNADDFSVFKKYIDAGDFVGCNGIVMKSKTGEISILVKKVQILSKSLLPLPEKFHGLKDDEERYRKRYLDLIMNPEVKEVFDKRTQIMAGIRELMLKKGITEVETPFLQTLYGGAAAKPFETHLNALNIDLFLAVSPELYLKRLIVGGYDKVYTMSRNFRNEGIDRWHNPEFTTLESYQAYANYTDVMEMVEQMISGLAQQVLGTTKSNWGDNQLDFKPPWPRLPLRETLLTNSNIDIEEFSEPVQLAQKMRKLGIEVTQEVSWGRMVDKLLSETVEPGCIQPVFLVDYPKAMSPLAKEKPSDSRYAERFEAFAGGMEIANAFSELNDPIEQRKRFEEQEELRRLHGNEELDRLDEDLLSALEYGMPPTGGLGVGIDRLVMLFTGQTSIREVLLFPHLSWSQSEVVRAVRREIEVMFDVNQALPNDALNQLKGRLPQEILTRVTDQQLLNYISNPRKT